MDADARIDRLETWSKLCSGCLRVFPNVTHTTWTYMASVSAFCPFTKREVDLVAYGLDKRGALLNLAEKLEDVLKNEEFLTAKKGLDKN